MVPFPRDFGVWTFWGFDGSLGSILCIQILAFTSWYISMYSVQSPYLGVHVSLGREKSIRGSERRL